MLITLFKIVFWVALACVVVLLLKDVYLVATKKTTFAELREKNKIAMDAIKEERRAKKQAKVDAQRAKSINITVTINPVESNSSSLPKVVQNALG